MDNQPPYLPPGLLSDLPFSENELLNNALRQLQLAGAPIPPPAQPNDALRRLQLAIDFSKIQEPYVNVTQGGGRIGYAFPIGKDDLTVGTSGGMANVKIDAPDFKQTIRDRQLSGLDAAYTSGPNTYGLEWGRGDPMRSNMQEISRLSQGAPQPNAIPQEFIRLFFRKQF